MPDEDPTHIQRKNEAVSNPFSTGGGGVRFEVQVMSAFATLMLADSFAPCLPCLPIRSIRLQARQAGYRIDDFVAHVSDANQTDMRRLLVQVKHGISFTQSDAEFRKTIAAAWRDFNNPAAFTRKKDAIAIIAEPLSATDVADTRRILEWVRSCDSPHEFFEKVRTTKFSSTAKREKLAAFRAHIDAAAGTPVNDDDVFEFLRHVHILGFDLDVCSGVMHALLHGIIGRQNTDNPAAIWARILEHVASFNPNAGTLTVDGFPDDVRAAFAPRRVEAIPASLASALPPKTTEDWNASEFAAALAVANLLGGWQEGSEADMSIVAALAPDQPSEWLRKMREVLQRPDSPLSYTNGTWTVKRRAALWSSLASRVFDATLSHLEECAKKVLTERDPMFELEPEQRFAAQVYGKVPTYSWALRNGLTETTALLGTNATQLSNCGLSAGEDTATVIIRGIFDQADWVLWASLGRLLPTLAEAAPNAFLNAVETALRQQSCPFDTIFAQERDVSTGGTYISGLLWALEALAWDEAYLVRVSVILAMLAARDPGGHWMNRPTNSLTSIFLPWFPQTCASIEKRAVAIRTVVQERQGVGWHLLMSLLPQQHSMSAGTYEPKWRSRLGSDAPPRPTTQEYWDQVSSYAQMAVELVRSDPGKLKELVDFFDSLPKPAFDEVLAFIESEDVISLPDEHRLPIWSALTSFVKKHRKYADADWTLPAEIVDKIDHVAVKLTPYNPMVRHRILFVRNTRDLHDDDKDWRKSAERLAKRQVDAIEEILGINGVQGVIAFVKQVENPSQVGFALGQVNSVNATDDVLPELVLSFDPQLRQFVQGFIWAHWQREQWGWFDKLNTASWSRDQIAQALLHLPFKPETWQRADLLLGEGAKEYWARVPVHRYQQGDADYVAVDALLKHKRPRAALACLAARVDEKLRLDPNRAVEALLSATTSNEADPAIAAHDYAMVIKALQDEGVADKSKLMSVEWAYLGLLERSQVTDAKTLNATIATDPQCFCEIIRKVFRSDREMKDEQHPEPTEEERAFGQNAYRLLHGWSTVPGTDASGIVSAESLTSWIDAVKGSLGESGHLAVGLHKAGEVFIHATPGTDGLFMSHAVAGVLNREDMDELRRGYELAVYNSRGAHMVDPTGAPEKQLAATYSQRANAVENAGYHRLAVTLRSIADSYTRDAERIIARYGIERDDADT